MKLCVVGTGADRDPDDPHKWVGTAGNALYLYELGDDGTLSQLDGPVGAGVNPMFAMFHAVGDNLLVYAVDMDDDAVPSVRGFAVDSVTKKLSEVSKVSSLGKSPCHLTVGTSEGKTYCFVANYTGGTVAAIPVNEDGTLGEACDSVDLKQFFKPQPHGRQEKSHPHGVTYSEAHRSLYVCDLGCNVVARFTFDAKHGTFDQSSAEACIFPENAGPRHVSFGSKDESTGITPAYAINELDNTVTILNVDADGKMSIKKSVSTLPEGYDGPKPFDFYDAPSHAAEVMVSQEHGIVMATNRGHDSIATLSLDGELLNTTPSGGRLPWTLVEKEGLIVANNQFNKALRDPGNITVFKRKEDDSSGTAVLECLGAITLSKPMCADICSFETVDDRADALGLPPAPKAAGLYKPALINSGHVHLAGHGPLKDDETYITGKVDLSGQLADGTTGYDAGRQCALASLATLKATLGTLSKIKQLVRTLGMVNAPADFTDHVNVINGFSDVMKDVFGADVGIGVRSAVGMASLPFNIPVEVESTWELK